MAGSTEYSPDHICSLSGADAIRARPSMYIGATGSHGIAHLVGELVSNSVDRFLTGHATHVMRRLDGARIAVSDDGDGLPLVEYSRRQDSPLPDFHDSKTHDGHAPHAHARTVMMKRKNEMRLNAYAGARRRSTMSWTITGLVRPEKRACGSSAIRCAIAGMANS
jgi:hypothetical protein